MNTETIHPADELADIRVQMQALSACEHELCLVMIAGREQRVGRTAHTMVSERLTRDGVIEPVVMSYLLPTLEKVLTYLRKPLLVIDCETTGFYPARGDRVLSLGMVRAQYGWVTSIGVMHGWIRNEQ